MHNPSSFWPTSKLSEETTVKLAAGAELLLALSCAVFGARYELPSYFLLAGLASAHALSTLANPRFNP